MSYKGEIVIYQTKDKKVELEVNLQQETVWLNLNQMVTLFGRDKSVISRHLHNIFRTEELERESVVANFATTAADGKTYQIDYYNLDTIISVGYRVNSKRGIQFRMWATSILRKHLVDGYTLNEQRLKLATHKLQSLQRAIKLICSVKARKALDYKEDGAKRIADNALVALTLMIAESDPRERDIILTLAVNLINKDN